MASEGQMKSAEKHLENMGDKKLANMQTTPWKYQGSSGGWQSSSYSGPNLCGYGVFVLSSDWLCKPERAGFLFLPSTLPFFFHPFFLWQVEMMYHVPVTS